MVLVPSFRAAAAEKLDADCEVVVLKRRYIQVHVGELEEHLSPLGGGGGGGVFWVSQRECVLMLTSNCM